MNKLIFSNGQIVRRKNWLKRITVNFVSDVVYDIKPFTVKHLNPDNYDDQANYISADGESSILTITGSTWAEIETIRTAIEAEFRTKFTAFRNSQNVLNAPVTTEIDLDV